MRVPGGCNCCPSHVRGGPWVRWGEGLLPRVVQAGRSPEPTGLRLLAGVSAQSFLHCFTLASAAFNLQVATPGVSPAPRVSRRVTSFLGGPTGPGPQGHCTESLLRGAWDTCFHSTGGDCGQQGLRGWADSVFVPRGCWQSQPLSVSWSLHMPVAGGEVLTLGLWAPTGEDHGLRRREREQRALGAGLPPQSLRQPRQAGVH